MKRLLKTICIFLSLAFAFTAITFCWFTQGDLVNFRTDFSSLGSAKAAYFKSGNGSREKPYEISSSTHFYNFAWLQYLGYFNHAEANNGRYQSYFRLADNIDMSGLNSALPPIGTSKYPFIGNFDGCGYTVQKVTISNKLNGSDGELVKNYLNVRPSVVDNFAANKTVLPVWGDTSKDVNIVGLFGVTGDYGSTATAGGVVQDAYGIYSETNTEGKLWDSLKSPAKSISDVDANSTEKAYYGAMSVANFYADNLHVRSASDSTLVGLAAGYANAAIGSVGVYRCDITVKAGATGLSDSSPLSNYSLLGDYNNAVITWSEKPSSGGSSGDQSGWGGSIDMRTLARRINYIYGAKTTVKNPSGVSDTGFAINVASTTQFLFPSWNRNTNQALEFFLGSGTMLPLSVDKETMGLSSWDSEEKMNTTNNIQTNSWYTGNGYEIIGSSNTGYIVGSNTASTSSGVRVKVQPIASSNGGGIFRSLGFKTTQSSATYSANNFVMLTIGTDNKTYRISDDFNKNATQTNDAIWAKDEYRGKLHRYESVRKNINEMMNGNQIAHGLRFFNFNASKYTTKTLTNVSLPGITGSYTLIEGGINFKVAKKGYVTAISGAFARGVQYDPQNKETLFNLFKVERNNDNSIASVTEIKTIYTDSSDNIYYNPTDITDKTLAISFSELSGNTGVFESGTAYYTEFPVNEGDYFISGTQGSNTSNAYTACLMYLDIGANAGGESGGGSTPGTAAYTIDTVDFVNNTTDYAANGKFTAFKDVTFNLSGAGTSGVPSVSFERAAAADGEDTASTKVAYIYSNITVLVTPKDGSLSLGPEKKENAA